MKPVLLLWLSLFSITACSTDKAPSATFLSFVESDAQGEYSVRMLVSEKFLRIEDGVTQDGFILLDRAARVVYSINHEDKSVLVMRSRPVTLSPPKVFTHAVERVAENLPAVDGKPVVHYRLLTNRENCFDVYAAKGLLPEALAALREFHQALAGEQSSVQAQVPAGFQSPCDLADHIFLPTRYLDQGFPVRQVNRAGVMRQLVNYKTGVPIEPGIFDIPKEYKQLTTEQLRG